MTDTTTNGLQPAPTIKSRYNAPKLQRFGSVVELTQKQGSCSTNDGQGNGTCEIAGNMRDQ